LERDAKFYETLLDSLYDGVYFLDRDRKISFWNKGAERITGYTGDEVLGSCCKDNILVHVDCKGMCLCEGSCPAVRVMEQGCQEEADVFLHHKDGYRILVRARVTPIRDENGSIVGAVEVFSDNSEKLASMSLIQELQEKAFQDLLTGLPNRHFLENFIMSRMDERSRYGWSFGLMFIDIDHFKLVNDGYGHHVGDDTLRMIARTLMNMSRSFDTVGRWGGEEFVAVVINVDRESLAHIAERYRAMIESSSLGVGEETLRVTVSVGATLAQDGDTLLSLVKRADGLMYRSKQAGRNRVTIDDGPVRL
jgi:diguanylate cyclase (GGDEF)-like protein/PAS domain S-box-containing protein